eukprot:6174686-Pleurochrysis_carterae.AAC.3
MSDIHTLKSTYLPTHPPARLPPPPFTQPPYAMRCVPCAEVVEGLQVSRAESLARAAQEWRAFWKNVLTHGYTEAEVRARRTAVN